MRLDIVMPAHNEQDRIDRTLRAYRVACPQDGGAPRVYGYEALRVPVRYAASCDAAVGGAA